MLSSTIPASLNPVVIVHVPVIVALYAALARSVSLSHMPTYVTLSQRNVGGLKPPMLTPPMMRRDSSICG